MKDKTIWKIYYEILTIPINNPRSYITFAWLWFGIFFFSFLFWNRSAVVAVKHTIFYHTYTFTSLVWCRSFYQRKTVSILSNLSCLASKYDRWKMVFRIWKNKPKHTHTHTASLNSDEFAIAFRFYNEVVEQSFPYNRITSFTFIFKKRKNGIRWKYTQRAYVWYA